MSKKYVLMIGRFQPFHNGHKYLVDALIAGGKKVCIAIRDVPTDEKNPYPSWLVKNMIYTVYGMLNPNIRVITIPDIEMVVVGRKVGYGLLQTPDEIKQISATNIREGKSFDLPEEVKEIIEKWKKRQKMVNVGSREWV